MLRSRSLPKDDDENDAGVHCKRSDKTGENIIGLKKYLIEDDCVKN